MDDSQNPKPQPTDDPDRTDDRTDDRDGANTATASTPPEEQATAAPPDSVTHGATEAQPGRGRLFRLRSLIAVAAAGVVLGAAGGATVAVLVDGDHDRPDRSFSHGERGEGGEGHPGMPPSGQVPGVVPEDGTEEDAPAVPDDTSTS